MSNPLLEDRFISFMDCYGWCEFDFGGCDRAAELANKWPTTIVFWGNDIITPV